MKKRPSTTLIGAFVVGGLALLAAAIIGVAGNDLLKRKERAVMYFGGSIYGLQVGAPVVFRGVRVGSVTSIRVTYDKARDRFLIPVMADLERDAVGGIEGKRTRGEAEPSQGTLQTLVERGLRAQLSMQSLLTGLLYVDLDLRPASVAEVQGGTDGAVEIPTASTAIQNLKQQLDGMDFRRLLDDVSAVAASARSLVGGPQLKQALEDLQAITGSLKRLSARLDSRIEPLALGAERTLGSARSAMDRLGAAADGVNNTAQRLGGASDRASALLAPDSALMQQLQLSAEELGKTASALRQTTAPDSPLLRNTERVMQDLSRAARSLRELSETLEQNPEALLRGKARP